MSEWVITLEPWIIQDGNYGDFSRGQRAEFAVEFYAEQGLGRATDREPVASPLGDGEYDLVASIVAAAPEAWVIDCGISVFREGRLPAALRTGELVGGRARLGIDPFFYFERLAKYDDLPPLIYSWDITRVEARTAPWVSGPAGALVADMSRVRYQDVEGTDAWAEDPGSLTYFLHCRLLDEAPKRTSATASYS